MKVAPVTLTTTHPQVAVDTFNPYAYDPNFTYLLTTSEVTSLTGSINVFTPTELLSAISAGLLNTTTSTEVNQITGSTANIVASSITIHAAGGASSGNVGSVVNPVTNFNPTADVVGFEVGTSITGQPVQLALAAAQQQDLNFLAATPVVATGISAATAR